MASVCSSNSYDVVIVGSGPAGSSAAYCLAKQGVRVTVLEKGCPPRYKTCGGGIVYRAVRLLPVSIQEAVERDCFTAELHLPGTDFHFLTRRNHPIVSMTMRDKFDFLLLGTAERAGAKICSQCEVLDVVQGVDKVKIITNRGSIWTRFVVAADGAMSMVARRAGWEKAPHLMPALECEVSVSHNDLRKFSHAARFDFAVVPSGYAWIFPKKEHLSIGVLNAGRGRINLNQCFESYLKFVGITEIKSLQRHGFVIPASPRKGTFVKRRVLLAGDAAGLADPVTGEGITFAIRSGQLAAKALLEGDFKEARVRQLYTAELSRGILSELRLGKLLARMTYECPRIRTRLFLWYGQKLCEAMTDVLTGEKTYKGIFLDPANYLKLFRYALNSEGGRKT